MRLKRVKNKLCKNIHSPRKKVEALTVLTKPAQKECISGNVIKEEDNLLLARLLNRKPDSCLSSKESHSRTTDFDCDIHLDNFMSTGIDIQSSHSILTILEPKINDYVVVRFCTKKLVKHYIGVIQSTELEDYPNDYLIKFVKKKTVLSFSSSNDEGDSSTFSLPTSSTTKETSTPQLPSKKRSRKILLNDNLAVSLDVAKLTNRKATVILTTTLQSLGCDPSTYNINISSIRRQRINIQQKNAEALKSDFKAEVPLTIHWDGKMIDISGYEIVDRLPIIVSGKGIEQLLAVPKLIKFQPRDDHKELL
ncbi:unnamed protein product [Brassicogethes aeneus]|uniref:Uncharacterized protein n=1 Tax=Brassicogethes aeneus TaxID=1431903 RepID=A0A9P0BEX2_BRAAE|nr:unnamed protein product [Brassicogethes aeneus]